VIIGKPRDTVQSFKDERMENCSNLALERPNDPRESAM
jgi:hypothetical protein